MWSVLKSVQEVNPRDIYGKIRKEKYFKEVLPPKVESDEASYKSLEHAGDSSNGVRPPLGCPDHSWPNGVGI